MNLSSSDSVDTRRTRAQVEYLEQLQEAIRCVLDRQRDASINVDEIIQQDGQEDLQETDEQPAESADLIYRFHCTPSPLRRLRFVQIMIVPFACMT